MKRVIYVIDLTVTSTLTQTVAPTSATNTTILMPVDNWPEADDWKPSSPPPPAVPMKRLPLDGRRQARARHGFQQMARVPCYRGSRTR